MSRKKAQRLGGRRATWLGLSLAAAALFAMLGATTVSADGLDKLDSDAYIAHLDIDAASEDAAWNTDGYLDSFHDGDDAIGSFHSACLVDGSGLVDGDKIKDLTWVITNTAGSPTVELQEQFIDDNGDPCVRWTSSAPGDQTIVAFVGKTDKKDVKPGDSGYVYANGWGDALEGEPGQPLIKEWNTIDSTKIVKVGGDVGDTLDANTGELDNWTSAPSGECYRDGDDVTDTDACVSGDNKDGQTIEIGSALITAGDNQGLVYPSADPSFIEYALGQHAAYDGPIDGVYQTFTIWGTCGSARIEDPVTGDVHILSNNDSNFDYSVTLSNSDKGAGFQILGTSDGEYASGPQDPDLDCGPNGWTEVDIDSTTQVQLWSDPIELDTEWVEVDWTVPPPVNKQPILAWAGQRVVLEHNWREALGSPFAKACPFTGTEDSNYDHIHVLYLKQAQGPGAFTAGIVTDRDTELLPDAAMVSVLADLEEGEPNSDCISRQMYESQDPGEVDISAYIVGHEDDLADNDPWSGEVDFLIYFMKLESIDVGIVEGTWSGHNYGDFTRTDGHPFDASKDVESTSSNVSADVLVRARVKGWFLNSNLTDREAEVSNGFTLPAGRWVMPDDWQKLAGGALAMDLRPNYDIMWDPENAPDDCTDSDGYKTWTLCGDQDDVAGPFSLLDGPADDDGKAPTALWASRYRDTWLPDGVINMTDAPMPPALVTFNRSDAGFLKRVDKRNVYDANPYYATHIPAEPWIPPFTAGGQGYRWDSWGSDGVYWFWDSWLDGSNASKAMVYSDNHGEAMVVVNGDDVPGGGSLTYDECSDSASLAANGIVSLAGEYCENGDVVGSTDVSATADYPDKRKHQPVGSNTVSIDWTWGGLKQVTIEDGEDVQFKYVVLHVLDRDGFCADSPSLHPVLTDDWAEPVDFVLDVIGGGRIVGVSNDGTIEILGQEAHTTLAVADPDDGIAELAAGECQAWVKISNSLLGQTDVLVTAHDPEGAPVFDRIVDFSTSVEYTLHFRWTLITWPGEDGIAVGDAIANIVGDVTAVYGWDADAQVWLAYFPEGVGVPGANDLATLNNGEAYWIAIAGPGDVSWEIATNVD